jgi:hypothetical protein
VNNIIIMTPSCCAECSEEGDIVSLKACKTCTEYDEAVRDKGNEIRNRTAYLFGVVKRYKTMAGDGMNPLVNKQAALSDKVLVSKFDNISSPHALDSSTPFVLHLLPFDCCLYVFLFHSNT